MSRINRLTVFGIVVTLVLSLGSASALAEEATAPKGQDAADQKTMRGLDEQVQEIKSEVLSISEELNRLEETLLFPSGTQIAVFVALNEREDLRLDSVQMEINGELVAHYIYSAKELEALQKGGVQRLYVGNVATGEHALQVLVQGKLSDGTDYEQTKNFTFRKAVEPKIVELNISGPNSDSEPIALGEW